MNGATGNIYVGLHEFSDMAFTIHFLRKGDLFVDIGANIGSYTILSARVCGAAAIAFEPDPDTAAWLRRNIALNEVAGLVEVRQAAVGAKAGQVMFSIGLDTVNHVVGEPGTASRIVPLEALDAALAGRSPALIKMDVEGYECEVLRGATETLSNPGLYALVVEDRSPATHAILTSAGFSEYAYNAFTRTLTPGLAEPTHNALWLRQLDLVQDRVASASRIRVLGVAI